MRSQIPTSEIWIGGYLDSTGIISGFAVSSREEDYEEVDVQMLRSLILNRNSE
jgi:hypothetical protein